MPVKVYLILKVLDKNVINIIGDINIPCFDLQNDGTIENQLSKFLYDNYKLVHNWLDVRHVNTKIMFTSPHLGLFYSSFVPMEFISGSTIKYITNSSEIPTEIREEIQQSLRLYPY